MNFFTFRNLPQEKETENYSLGFYKGSKFIQCRTCQHRSFNPNDIKNKYCAYCNRFHETGLPRTLDDVRRLT